MREVVQLLSEPPKIKPNEFQASSPVTELKDSKDPVVAAASPVQSPPDLLSI